MSVEQLTERGRAGGGRESVLARALPRLIQSAALMPQLSRYAVASGVALAVDFGIFLILNSILAMPTLAGVAGYACGIVVHYGLSRRFVFQLADARKSHKRLFGEFVASGLVGLAVTAAVFALGTAVLGLPPLSAKALAAAGSFAGVFLIRRTIVFA
jgi:putative flippase GtrA